MHLFFPNKRRTRLAIKISLVIVFNFSSMVILDVGISDQSPKKEFNHQSTIFVYSFLVFIYDNFLKI